MSDDYSKTVRRWHNIGLWLSAPFAIAGWLAAALKTNEWIWGRSIFPGDFFIGAALISVAVFIYACCRGVASVIDKRT